MTLPQSGTKLQFMAHHWKTYRKAVGSEVGLQLLAALDSSLMAISMGKNPIQALCLAHTYLGCPAT